MLLFDYYKYIYIKKKWKIFKCNKIFVEPKFRISKNLKQKKTLLLKLLSFYFKVKMKMSY